MAYSSYDPYHSQALTRQRSIGYGSMTPMPPYSDDGVYDRRMSTSYMSSAPSQYYGDSAMAPMMHRRTSSSYDDLALQRTPSYYPEHRMIAPAMIPPRSYSRSRRQSSVSFSDTMVPRPPTAGSYHRRSSSMSIKFKRKGAFSAGITLGEAQSRHGLKLSNNDTYTLNDLHVDRRGAIHLRVHWAGYNSLTYEIPLDDGDRRLDLRTLARRVTRACLHYFQTNMIPVQWDRIELHHLEEIGTGTWQPMLSAR